MPDGTFPKSLFRFFQFILRIYLVKNLLMFVCKQKVQLEKWLDEPSALATHHYLTESCDAHAKASLEWSQNMLSTEKSVIFFFV